MFGCCCVNKKALKKEQAKNESKTTTAEAVDDKKLNEKNGNNNVTTKSSPQKVSATDAATSPVSEGRNDKSNSSEEGNNFNLSGLIMSDGLVGMCVTCNDENLIQFEEKLLEIIFFN